MDNFAKWAYYTYWYQGLNGFRYEFETISKFGPVITGGIAKKLDKYLVRQSLGE